MNVTILSYSLDKGGAAIAAKNFYGILNGPKLNFIPQSITQDNAGRFQFFKRVVSFALAKLQFDSNSIKHSLNLFSYSPVLEAFHNKDNCIFHLHWINNDTLSVFDFDKIPVGSIITLHDEWLYCGAEHYYKVDDLNLDFISGYGFFKEGVWGIHLNYLIWKIKYQQLDHRTDLIYTVPSSWMLSRASQSLMLRNADIRLLPNLIEGDMFNPNTEIDVKQFRDSIGILPDDIVLVFGAIGGKTSYLKGAHLLNAALKILSTKMSCELAKKIKFIDFGGTHKGSVLLHGFENISFGYIGSKTQLALLYSSANCVVVPSLVESFGQVAAEALACETPVVCFNYSGLTDIVIDGYTGLLAEPYSVTDLADKINKMIFLNKGERNTLGKNGRKHVIKKFSYPVVSNLYSQIIEDAIELKAKIGN